MRGFGVQSHYQQLLNNRKTVFYSVQYIDVLSTCADPFHMFTQSIKFFAFLCYILNSTVFEQDESLYSQKMNGCSFQQLTTQFELAFALSQESTFSQRFYLKANRKSIVCSKKRQQGFSKQPCVLEIGMFLRDNHWKFQTFSII